MNAPTDNTSLTVQASRAIDRRNNYWVSVREAGKEARLCFTDAIADFNNYKGGSQSPAHAYSRFTRSIYAPFGLNKQQVEDKRESRDALDVIILDALRLIEGSAASILREGMAKGRSRAEIKDAVREMAKAVAATIQRVGRGDFFDGEVIQ